MNLNVNLNEFTNELRNLDFNNVGTWSRAAKITVACMSSLIIAFAGYWLFIRDQYTTLEQIRAQEGELRAAFEAKQQKVANLDAYKQQLEQMRISFGTLLRQLPSQTEIANLLQDISQTRVAVGLDEDLFKPEAERPKEFYAEAPIKIRMIGTYHQFGEFASGLAALPRIVTLDGIDIKPAGKDADGKLVMDATAMTYRYLAQDGHKATEAAAKPHS